MDEESLRKRVEDDAGSIMKRTGYTKEQVGFIVGMLGMFYLGVVFLALIQKMISYMSDTSLIWELMLLFLAVIFGLLTVAQSMRMFKAEDKNKVVWDSSDVDNVESDIADDEGTSSNPQGVVSFSDSSVISSNKDNEKDEIGRGG